MEEREYHSTYRNVNPLECPFERGLLRQCLTCSQVRRIYIAEREGIGCAHEGAHKVCEGLYDAMLENGRFALKINNPDAPLPHGKRIKVECGGLLGLQTLVHPEREGSERVDDVYAVVQKAVADHGSLEGIPYQRLMPAISHFQARPRRK